MVRIFNNEWSTDKRQSGTVGELSSAAELRARAEAQVANGSPEFVSPNGGAPKGNRNAVKDKETTHDVTKNSSNKKKVSQGTSAEYALRRLAREGRTDLLDRYERGELSANAAAIEAGFRKAYRPMPSSALEWLDHVGEGIKSEGRVQTLRELVSALPDDEFELLKQWINQSR